MKRRSFLQQTAALTSMAAVTPQMLAGMPVRANSPILALSPTTLEGDSILILIQLFGGNDGLNTIIPADNPQYYNFRPTLAVKKTDAVRWLNTDLYFHPALVNGIARNGFAGLMDEGRLAVIQDVGYENPNLSHFRSTDIWLSGINSSDPYVRLSDGWLGRLFVEALPNFPQVLPEHPLCVQIGGSLSLALQSSKGDMGIALTDPQKFFELGQGLSPNDDAMSEDTAYGKEFNYVRSIAKQSDSYSQIVDQAFKAGKTTQQYPQSGLGFQLGLIARLISGGLKSRVYMCTMGGFDTHVEQQSFDVATNGIHPRLLNQLASGVTLFMRDALQQGFGERVVGMTVSEFGRRPYENGSRGTDHGAASVQFVFGDGASIRSSRYGNAPDLVNMDRNGDVRYQNDYRRVYADVLQNWFGASEEETTRIMGERIAPLNVIKKRTTSLREDVLTDGTSAARVMPNPSLNGDALIRFELQSTTTITVDIFSMRGTHVQSVFKGVAQPGEQSYPVYGLRSGSYICSISTSNGQLIHLPLTVAL